ncbi:MAG: molybdopterin molybdotransferase MoeA [Bacteroidetes bacterium]|nr:molybdopterin molybdotransferase MoeA [Bacteroidota bacterium]
MVSVAEAEEIIQQQLFKPLISSVALFHANQKILAEEIVADRDLPPFDRVTMDGIAVAYLAFEHGAKEFVIENLQSAGSPRKKLVDEKKCIEVMTGAPLPSGTDTVIPYENLNIKDKTAFVLDERISKNQNVHRQGLDAKTGDVLLNTGTKLSPAEIAVLASVGKSQIKIFKTPKAAVISTGDELVDVDQTPLPHQIRKSNSYALVSALNELGCEADSYHLKDDEAELTKNLKSILEKYELIVLSGGVSKGKFDFVPNVLESLRVKKIFHGVSQRPGKPMWVGVSNKNFVFALPGNPVSTLMCFHRYVKPWLQKSFGEKLKTQTAILASDFSFAPQLTYFLQVKIENENGKLMAHPHVGGGSGDFANLKEVDGFLELQINQTHFEKGSAFQFIPLRQ